MVDLVAAKAVKRAGYQCAGPAQAVRMGAELLEHPLVKQEIDNRMAEKREKAELSASYVIQKLIDIVDNTEKDNPQAALRGLELLGKHLGLYRERQEISGPDGEAIQMEQKVKQDVADFTSRLARLAPRGGEAEVVKLPVRKGDTGA